MRALPVPRGNPVDGCPRADLTPVGRRCAVKAPRTVLSGESPEGQAGEAEPIASATTR